jgi:hypothetical protein
MNTITDLTVDQLKRAVLLREKIDSLERELGQLLGGSEGATPTPKGRRKMSAASRALIAAAQKARWAKTRGKKTDKAGKPKRKMSASARAAISAAAKERWKKAKAAGKTKL